MYKYAFFIIRNPSYLKFVKISIYFYKINKKKKISLKIFKCLLKFEII